MIIIRYLTKEVLLTFLAITGILFGIALSNRFAVFLAKAASGELPISLVFQLIWLYAPELLSLVIPLSFFIAILFAYGRLHADSEMTVLSACGLSWKYICKLTLYLSLIIMLVVGCLTLWIMPKTIAYREKVMSKAEVTAVFSNITPGRFQTLSDGNLVFYLEDLEKDTQALKGVFIAQLGESQEDIETIITASDAAIKKTNSSQIEKKDNSNNPDSIYLILKQGFRYQGKPGQADYTVVEFDEYGRGIETNGFTQSSEILKQKKTMQLFRSDLLEDKAELQWRLSIPLSVPILSLIAIPLARVRPRQGRFAKLLPAILFFIVYYNLFTVAKRWVAAGSLPVSLGVWWVHAAFLVLGWILLAKESGYIRRVLFQNMFFTKLFLRKRKV